MIRSVARIHDTAHRPKRTIIAGRKTGCVGSRWSLHLGQTGVVGAAWCPWRALDAAELPLLRREAAASRPDRTEALAAWRRARRVADGHAIILNPREDVFVNGDAQATSVALDVLRGLLDDGTAVALTTRVGLHGGAALVTLARRYTKRLTIRVGIFGGSLEDEKRWEPGLPGRADRLALVTALTEAGASVEVEIGPVIPFINDNDLAWKGLLRAVKRAGANVVVPRFLAGAPELVHQVEKEIAPSAGRMILGWLSTGLQDPWFRASRVTRRAAHSPGNTADLVRALPLQARQPRLRRFTELAEQAHLTVRSCSCFDGGRAHVCHALPVATRPANQLDLFGALQA